MKKKKFERKSLNENPRPAERTFVVYNPNSDDFERFTGPLKKLVKTSIDNFRKVYDTFTIRIESCSNLHPTEDADPDLPPEFQTALKEGYLSTLNFIPHVGAPLNGLINASEDEIAATIRHLSNEGTMN